MVSSLVNATHAYREREDERREVPLTDFVRARYRQFEQR
jgi:hypothetical protein